MNSISERLNLTDFTYKNKRYMKVYQNGQKKFITTLLKPMLYNIY